MALSGTMYSSSFGNGFFRLRLVWSATQNVSANTSTIKTTLYLDSISAYGAISDATNSPWNINIDGGNTSGSIQSDVSANGSKTLGSHTRTVTHGSDGKKTLTISAGHTIDISWSGSMIGARSLSGSITLNDIARTSTVGLVNTTAEMGVYNGIYVKIFRQSSSFTHTLKYSFGSKNGTIASKISWVDHEWTIPADFATETPNTTSGWGTITCETYNGNTLIGTSSVKFYANVPSNASYNPTITVPSLSEANTAVTSAVGAYYIQGKSKIKMTATGGTKYGATIKSIVFTVKVTNHSGSISGSTATAYSSPIESGTHSVKVTITDSRGRQNSATSSFNVTAYTAPRITSFNAFRTDSSSAIIQALGTASMTAIGTANTVTLKLSTSLKSKNIWTNIITITATSGASLTTATRNIANMDITNAYDVKLEVLDELTPVASVQIISVGTAIFPMSWGKTGVGVGTVFNPTGNALQVVGGASIDHYVPQKIPASSNLNNYTTPGFYYNNSDADTATIANTPTNNAFSLQVFRHAGFRQVFKIYATATPWTYERNFYSGAWGRWCLTSGTAGAALPMNNGWSYYGGSYQAPQYWLDGNDMVHLGGLIDYGTQKASVQVATLPVGYRPSSREMFSVYAYGKSGLRIDVTSAGEVLAVDSPTGFISLSGIKFRRDWYY